ncbi:MAG: hypothetical protein JWO03_18 [Bacteroidetes bacterium]|nr:hypothetical protein [Bacteroidota bacterium]
MFIEYLIAISLFVLYLSVIIWSFGKLPIFSNSTFSRKGLIILFAIKLIFGVGSVLVYTYYYTDRQYADIYKYFDDSKVIYDAIGEHPKTSFKVITGIRYDKDNPELKQVIAPTQHFDKKEGGVIEANHRFVIRLHVLLRFISRGNIYIHTLFFCFLSFIGCVALYRALQPFFEYGHGRRMIVPVFLVPSILFWSSGLLKETLVMFFLGLLLFAAFKLLDLRNLLSNLVITVVCILFIYLLKPFIALSFLAGFYVMATINFKGYVRIIAMLLGIGIVLWILIAHDAFMCDMMTSLVAKRNEFIVLGLKMKAGSLTDTAIRPLGCLEPLRLIPSALYNMFMLPAVWSKSLFEKIFGLENLSILLFTVVALFYFKRPKRAKLQLVAFCFVFFSLNYALIGITVPIIGALVHYKVFGLLFYLILIFSLISLRKLIFDIKRLPMGEKTLFKAKKVIFR